jgi:ferric-dicitrate binding protein FerR (iron transport regulator)
MTDRALREALGQLAPDVPNDADAVLAEVKPRFRRARMRRRLGMGAGLAAAAGAVVAVVVLLIGPATSEPSGPASTDPSVTSSPGAPAPTNPPLTTGVPVPFTLEDERG